ncbi:MAG: NAD(P)-binding domain-containing protein [Tissierellia bacterium]|nr:NAD(P)-binding domain-containing protein [Tissierellia bacterium]
MILKTLITFKYTDNEFKSLEDLGYEIIFKDEKDLSFSQDMKNIDTMVCFDPFNKIDISMFPNLKWIQLLSAGINQVPVDKVLKQNITITNNRGGYSIPIAEWIVLKTLEMYKNSREFYERQNSKVWKMDTSILEIYGKTIGFIGTGSIAQEAAKRFKGFGMNIIGINASGRETKYFDQCFSVDKINEVVKQLDIIVIAAPYTEATHHLIDKSILNNIKDGAYLVNIARGSIIDEKALVQSLKSGKIKKAALDVFEIEPLPKDSPLWDMENVAISPHNSWASEMNKRRRYKIAYENMKRYINKKELINVIDLKKGY